MDKICKTNKKTNNAKMSSIKYKNYKRLNLLSHNKLFMFAHSHESYYFIINKVKSHYLNVNNAHLPLIGYKNIIASKPQMYKEQFKSHRLFKIIKRNRGFVLFNEESNTVLNIWNADKGNIISSITMSPNNVKDNSLCDSHRIFTFVPEKENLQHKVSMYHSVYNKARRKRMAIKIDNIKKGKEDINIYKFN